LWLQQPVKVEAIRDLYRQRYASEPLISISDDAPWVSRIAGKHGVEIGGFTVAPGGKRLVVVATLDNLLKGAATQAMQNLNLAFGFEELTSISTE
jgi:N-acetyl-gamma-glutamyl-phosphate reductase